MAPIPTSLSEEAADLVSALQRRQRDLVKVQIPRLRSCQGPLSLQQNYAGELREDCDTFERDLEALDLCVDDQRGEKNRAALRALVGDYRGQLSSIRQESRAALLTSKRAIDSQSKSRREELLGSVNGNEKQASRSSEKGEDALMKTNNDITDALRRTIAVMGDELKRSVLTVQILEDSTATLKSTSTTHDTLTNVMDVSKQLVAALESTDWLDRLLILSAFFFFLLVILLILKERILDRSLRIAFWWTRFIPFGSSSSSIKETVTPPAASLASSTVLAVSSSLTSVAGSVAATLTASATSASASADPSSLPTGEEDSEKDPHISSTLSSIIPPESASLVSSVEEPTPTPAPSPLLHEDEL